MSVRVEVKVWKSKHRFFSSFLLWGFKLYSWLRSPMMVATDIHTKRLYSSYDKKSKHQFGQSKCIIAQLNVRNFTFLGGREKLWKIFVKCNEIFWLFGCLVAWWCHLSNLMQMCAIKAKKPLIRLKKWECLEKSWLIVRLSL